MVNLSLILSTSIETAAPQPSIDESGGNDTVAASPTLRRSSRIRQAPDRYGH